MRIASRPLFPPFFRRSIMAFAGGCHRAWVSAIRCRVQVVNLHHASSYGKGHPVQDRGRQRVPQ
jgi:hypothetical protein